MKKINVAFVGCGRISDLHYMGYKDREDSSLVALCDSNESRAKSKAKEWGVSRVYKDFNELLKQSDIDLVELLVPHNLHCGMTLQALRAGKHVSVQKPMALNLAEADEIIAEADKKGLVLRIYENFVFYPPNVEAKRLLKSGAIGEPQIDRKSVV